MGMWHLRALYTVHRLADADVHRRSGIPISHRRADTFPAAQRSARHGHHYNNGTSNPCGWQCNK